MSHLAFTLDSDVEQSTEELVIAAQNGSMEGFNRLFTRFQQLVENVLRRIVSNPDLVEDIRQDVFLLAFTKLQTLRTPAAFPAWICQIARRRALNLLTRKRLIQVEVRTLEAIAPEQRGPVEVAETRELQQQVRSAVSALQEIDREVIQLREFQGLSYEEVAERLKVPLGTAKRRMHVARNRLHGSFHAIP